MGAEGEFRSRFSPTLPPHREAGGAAPRRVRPRAFPLRPRWGRHKGGRPARPSPAGRRSAPPRPASLAPRPTDRLVAPQFRGPPGEVGSARNVPQVFWAGKRREKSPHALALRGVVPPGGPPRRGALRGRRRRSVRQRKRWKMTTGFV